MPEAKIYDYFIALEQSTGHVQVKIVIISKMIYLFVPVETCGGWLVNMDIRDFMWDLRRNTSGKVGVY